MWFISTIITSLICEDVSLTMLAMHVNAGVPLVVVALVETVARVAFLATDTAVHTEHHLAVTDACRAVTRQVVDDPALLALTPERT